MKPWALLTVPVLIVCSSAGPAKAQEQPQHASGASSTLLREYRRNADLIARLERAIERKVESIRRLSDEVRELKRRVEQLGILVPTPPFEFSEFPQAPPAGGLSSAIERQRVEIAHLEVSLRSKRDLERRLQSRRDQLRDALRSARRGPRR